MANGVRASAKLVIIPFKDVDSTTGKLKGLPGIPFVAPYNPTTFSFGADFVVVNKDTTKTEGGEPQPLRSENKVLNVELFLDGTGASPPLGLPFGKALGLASDALAAASGSSVSAINAEAATKAVVSSVAVTALVNYFFGITANLKQGVLGAKKTMSLNMETFNKDTHTTNPLKIIWGTGLFFNCRLKDATVNYKLFNQLGMPLRATISASFVEIPKVGKKFSPDLTKIVVVKAGDTIYNLAKQEYEDESYYIKIAEANDLKNYRRLIPGQELILPPIAKVDE